ncbi:DNA repair protein RecO [Lactobacillus porci]|uniref:DNA repair protein RecO n=1 Tax=Lactobacillus porci TaxID=2012477 RepID=UPI0039931414
MAFELLEVHGIIYKRQKYQEADLLAKILTKELGPVTVILKGALRPKSKLASVALPFTEGSFTILTKRRGISQFRTYKDLVQHDELFGNLLVNAYASFIFDLLDHAAVEYQPVGKYYQLVLTAFHRLLAGQDAEILTQIVQLQLLEAYGVKPELSCCLVCGKVQGTFDYSISLGGVVCSDHFSRVQRMHLAPKTVALLRTLGLVPIDRLGSIQIDDQLKEQSRQAIDLIYQETVDLNLRTKKFLDELKTL